jgi:ankyrin repeat protein
MPPKGLMPPVERRRQLARRALQETAELASLLCHDDSGEPIRYIVVTEQENGGDCHDEDTEDERSGLLFPSSPSQQDCLKQLLAILTTSVDASPATGGGDRLEINCGATDDALKAFLKENPQTIHYWIPAALLSSLPQLKQELQPSEENRIHPVTPTCLHLVAYLGNSPGWHTLMDCLEQEAKITNTNSTTECTTTTNHPNDKRISIGNQEGGETPLHLAMRHCHTDLVRSMCSRTPNACRILDQKGNLPLHLAADARLVHQCLAPAATTTGIVQKKAALLDSTSLAASALLAHFPMASAIPNDAGFLPIHLAASSGHLNVMKLLLTVSWQLVHAPYYPSNEYDTEENRHGNEGGDQLLHQFHQTHRKRWLPIDLCVKEHMRLVEEQQRLRLARNSPKTPRTQIPSTTKSSGFLTSEDRMVFKLQLEDCIDLLVTASLYQRVVIQPREERHPDDHTAPFFLPLFGAATSVQVPYHWDYLLENVYGSRLHVTNRDLHRRNLLHFIVTQAHQAATDRSVAAAPPAESNHSVDHDDGGDDDDDVAVPSETRESKDPYRALLYRNNTNSDYLPDETQLAERIRKIHTLHPMAHLEVEKKGRNPVQLAILLSADFSEETQPFTTATTTIPLDSPVFVSPVLLQALVDCGPEAVVIPWSE